MWPLAIQQSRPTTISVFLGKNQTGTGDELANSHYWWLTHGELTIPLAIYLTPFLQNSQVLFCHRNTICTNELIFIQLEAVRRLQAPIGMNACNNAPFLVGSP